MGLGRGHFRGGVSGVLCFALIPVFRHLFFLRSRPFLASCPFLGFDSLVAFLPIFASGLFFALCPSPRCILSLCSVLSCMMVLMLTVPSYLVVCPRARCPRSSIPITTTSTPTRTASRPLTYLPPRPCLSRIPRAKTTLKDTQSLSPTSTSVALAFGLLTCFAAWENRREQ